VQALAPAGGSTGCASADASMAITIAVANKTLISSFLATRKGGSS
jgi:hypothetical protein